MAEGPSRDLIVTNPPADEDTGNDSGAESVAATTYSPTHGAALMAKGEIHKLSDFFKKTSVTDDERQAYHERGWLIGNVISSVPEVDVPTVEGSTAICFESHLIVGLELLPRKFLVTIMGYLNCESFHFNPNAISMLSTFVMLCECWLGIASDTSLFWYYYSPARYSKVVYGGIGLSPYYRPQSSLDIVVVEHLFGRLFEAFQQISQAVRTDAPAGDDAQPSKRARAPSLKKLLVHKYVTALLTYFVANLYPCSDLTAIHRRPSASGPPKLATKLVTILKTAAPVAAAAVSSSEGGTGRTVLSTTDAWDSSRRVTDFLEGLKNREGTPCIPLLLQSP
jgi:hypothetical protein